MLARSLFLLCAAGAALGQHHRGNDWSKDDYNYNYDEHHQKYSPECVGTVPQSFYNCEAFPETTKSFFVCQSETAERVECKIPLGEYRKIGSLSVVQSHSDTPCEADKSYWLSKDSLFVSGCTATFAVTLEKDVERCQEVQAQNAAEGCQPLVNEFQTCAAGIKAACGRSALQDFKPEHSHHDWKSREADGFTRGHRGHHGHGRVPRWVRGAFPIEAQMGPFERSLGQCMQKHAGSFDAKCRETDMMQYLEKEAQIEKMIEEHWDVWMQRILRAGCALWTTWVIGIVLISLSGAVYFIWRRNQLQGRRQVSLEPKTGRWSTSLFMLDMGSLLPSCCFPWYQSALNQAEAHDRDSSVADIFMNLSSHSLHSNTYLTRQTLRNKYSIAEQPMKDCLTSVCCTPCANAQHMRELDIRQSGTNQVTVTVGVPAGPADEISGVPVKLASDAVMM